MLGVGAVAAEEGSVSGQWSLVRCCGGGCGRGLGAGVVVVRKRDGGHANPLSCSKFLFLIYTEQNDGRFLGNLTGGISRRGEPWRGWLREGYVDLGPEILPSL